MGHGNDRSPVRLEDLFPPSRVLGGALDLLPLPSLVLTDDGSAVAVNREWTRLSRVPADASRGQGWLGALEPLDRGPLRRLLAGAAAVGKPGSGDFRLAGPDGGQWCRWWWRPGVPGQLVVCVARLDQPVPGDSVPPPREAVAPARADDTADRPAVPALSRAAALDVADEVVNRLFSVGLRLASAACLLSGPAGARLEEAIEELDAIIKDVRSATFASEIGSGTGYDAG